MHIHSLQIGILSQVGAILLLSACSSPVPLPAGSEQQEAALNLLSHIQEEQILDTFHQLSKWSYTRHDHTVNRNSHRYQSSIQLARIDSSSVFTVMAGSDSVADLSTIIAAIIPEEAPYLIDRFMDEFFYETEEHTRYWSHPAGKITIQARPKSSQNIRSASFLYVSNFEKLVAANFHYHNKTILFEESSHYKIALRPAGTEWVPHRLSVDITMKLPFGKQQRFTRNVTFYNYISRSTG